MKGKVVRRNGEPIVRIKIALAAGVAMLLASSGDGRGNSASTAQAASLSVPPQATAFVQAGETAVAMRPVMLDGRLYQAVYFTTGTYNDSDGEVFVRHSAQFLKQAGIQAFVVLSDGQPVADPLILNRVFLSLMAGYLMSRPGDVPDFYGPVAEDMADQLDLMANNLISLSVFAPQRASSLLEPIEAKNVKTLNQILTMREVNGETTARFSADVRGRMQNGEQIYEALDAAATAAPFVKDRKIQRIVSRAKKLFDGWERQLDGQLRATGLEVKLRDMGGGRTAVKVGLDVGMGLLDAGIRCVYFEDLVEQRVDILEHLSTVTGSVDIPLPGQLRSAIFKAVEEARNPSNHCEAIVADVVRKEVIDVAFESGPTVVAKAFASWAAANSGKKLAVNVAHATAIWLLATAAVDIGFNLEELFGHAEIGLRGRQIAAQLKDAARLAKLTATLPGSQGDYYDGRLAEAYRASLLFMNLANMQVYRSYADVIGRGRLNTELRDLLSGGQWSQAEQDLRRQAAQAERDISIELEYPEVAAIAVDLAQTRLAQGPHPPIDTTAATATLLLVDASGSMSETDQTGVAKIEAARQAGYRFTRMIGRENTLFGGAHSMGLVAFSSGIDAMTPLAADPAPVDQVIAGLGAGGGTNMADGLVEAARLLGGANAGAKRILILLSDGVPTSVEDVRQRGLPAAAAASDCIYTIGLGQPDGGGFLSGLFGNSYDEALLEEIADTKPCGGFYTAANAFELANSYVRLRHASAGTVVADNVGVIAQGETTLPLAIDVPADQGQLHVTLNWPGSQLDLKLADPNGREVDANYPGATVYADTPPVYAIVTNPLAGPWTAQAYGRDVPEGRTDYGLTASTRVAAVVAPAAASRLGLMLAAGLMLGILGAGGALLVLASRTGRASTGGSLTSETARSRTLSTPAGWLRVRAPRGGAKVVPMVTDPFTIGRNPVCDLVVDDPHISRRHCRIHRTGAGWAVEDLGSTSGTRVNDQRIAAITRVHPGDTIRIGQTLIDLQPEAPTRRAAQR